MNKYVLFSVLLFPFTSYASNWVDLGKTNDNNYQSFLDLDSVRPVHVSVAGDKYGSEYISAVVQGTYINKHPNRKKGEYYTKAQLYINCSQNTFFLNSFITYGFKDEVLDSWRSGKSILSSGDFQYAFPDTIAEANVETSCYAAEYLAE